MIVRDASVQMQQGKGAEATALLKEIVAYTEPRWPTLLPRQVSVDLAGVWGRIHLITVRESLDEHEQHQAEQDADGHWQALAQQFFALTIPGSGRTELRRVV
jgi:hypothetical protein